MAVEIAYDPIGLYFSDIVPLRTATRVAHLHELLQFPDSYLEKRLPDTIHGYDHLVVADSSRAIHTQEILGLESPPLIVENYPLLGPLPTATNTANPRSPFEVIYCGSLGYNQKLDIVTRSIAKWPEQTVLTLIGDDNMQIARELKALAESTGVAHRVNFLGWMDVSNAEARLVQADLAVALLDTSIQQLRTALGASNKRYQYMKAGLPQIGDQSPGVPELIEGNGIGICVSDHSVDEIASAVRAYVENPIRCKVEASRALDLHLSQFHYERVFQRLLDALD